MDMKPVSIDATRTMLGVSRSTVYELLAKGELEAVPIGRRRLIKVSSIDRLVDGTMDVAA